MLSGIEIFMFFVSDHLKLITGPKLAWPGQIIYTVLSVSLS